MSPSGRSRGGPDRTLEEMEQRVQRVRHLDSFECTVRSDGRVSFRITRPPEELSADELESIAELLEEMAADIREHAAGSTD